MKITEQQQLILQQIDFWLREDVGLTESKWCEWNILRFCRARNFQIEEIKQMIQNYLIWYETNNIDQIGLLDKQKQERFKTLSCEGFCNVDREGRPIYLMEIRNLKLDQIFNEFTIKEASKFMILTFERMLNIIFPECSKLINKRIDTCIVVIDLSDVSLLKLFDNQMKQFLKLCIKISQDYYPEIMHKIYIINAGVLFKGI